jgi:hypothetical protein
LFQNASRFKEGASLLSEVLGSFDIASPSLCGVDYFNGIVAVENPRVRNGYLWPAALAQGGSGAWPHIDICREAVSYAYSLICPSTCGDLSNAPAVAASGEDVPTPTMAWSVRLTL